MTKLAGRVSTSLIVAATFSVGLAPFLYFRSDHVQKSQPPHFAEDTKSRTVSTSLARVQSYGFFTDISDANWMIAQQSHASLFPNFYKDLMEHANGPKDKGHAARLGRSNFWNGQNFQVEFICPLARRLPPDSMADGPKWVCDP